MYRSLHLGPLLGAEEARARIYKRYQGSSRGKSSTKNDNKKSN
jgi:hypothetical protein